jgi:hypothetical protein
MTAGFLSVVPGRAHVGANYAHYMNQMGKWFGPNDTDVLPGCDTITKWHQDRATASFPGVLGRLKEAGIHHLRLHLLSNAWNYGTGNGATFAPPPARATRWTDAYERHLTELLGQCRAAKMKVVLVFLGFNAFMVGQRPRLATDAALRKELLDRVLEPMLAATESFTDVVEAWEPVNEPNWCTRYWLSDELRPWGLWNGNPGVTVAEMQAFLDDVTLRIRRRAALDALEITHGFALGLGCRMTVPPRVIWPSRSAKPRSLPAFVPPREVSVSDESVFSTAAARATPTVSRYRRQFHYYPSAVKIPFLPRDWAGALPWPIPVPWSPRNELYFRNDLPTYGDSGSAVLGEISTLRADLDGFLMDPAKRGEVGYVPWRRLRGLDERGEGAATYHRLVLANQLGYRQIYLWPNRDHDPAQPESVLSNDALRGVVDFLTHRELPRVP